MTIEYINLRGAPPYVTAYLEPMETVDELWAYRRSLEADIHSMEDQLNGFERFGYWPRSNKWNTAEEWLDNVLGARHSRKWMLNIVKATLIKHYRDVKLAQIDASVNKLYEIVATLQKDLEEERSKRAGHFNALEGRVANLIEEEKTKRHKGDNNNDIVVRAILRSLYDADLISDNNARLNGVKIAISKNPNWGLEDE